MSRVVGDSHVISFVSVNIFRYGACISHTDLFILMHAHTMSFRIILARFVPTVFFLFLQHINFKVVFRIVLFLVPIFRHRDSKL